MKKFMFLIMGTGQAMAKMPKKEVDAHMQKWFAWDKELREKYEVIDGEALKTEPTLITGKDKKVSHDFQASKDLDRIGGFYLIKTESMEKAVEIAKGCPTFELDGIVEVREIMELS